ncbi:klcB, partial [Escherichia coli]
KRIIIVKVHPDTRQVWAHDDRPVTYKTNRAGRRVVDSDPSCIQSIYGFDQLRLIT